MIDHMASVHIRLASDLTDSELRGLAAVLIDCVAGGDSVGFMLPLSHERALSFWERVREHLRANRRAVLLAESEAGEVVGTVQLIFASADNQPHRADLAKMLVRRDARRSGVGAALLTAAERQAKACGRTVLVLDTASDAARRLYERCGWQRVGDVPGYALWPEGGMCATTFYYRVL